MWRYSTVHDPVHWPCCSEWQEVHYSSCAGTQLYTTLYTWPCCSEWQEVHYSSCAGTQLYTTLYTGPVAQSDRRFITLHVQVQYCTWPCTLALLLRVTGGSLLFMCRYTTVQTLYTGPVAQSGGSLLFMCRYSTVHHPVHWPCCLEWQEVHYSSCAGTVLYTTLYTGPVAQSNRRFITLHVQVHNCTGPCTLALLLRVTGGSLLFMCRCTVLYRTLYTGPVAQSDRRFITLHVQVQYMYCTWPCTLALLLKVTEVHCPLCSGTGPVAQSDRRFITLHVQVQYCTGPCTLALLLRVTGGSLLFMCRCSTCTVHDPVHWPCCSKWQGHHRSFLEKCEFRKLEPVVELKSQGSCILF